jgi:hypothetical protein
LGFDTDLLISHRGLALAADATLGGAIVNTADHPGVAANSMIISNQTTDGDIMLIGSDNGNSVVYYQMDGSANTHNFSGTLSVGSNSTYMGAGAGGINLQNDGGFGLFLQESSSVENYFGIQVNVGSDETRLTTGSGDAARTTPMVFYTAASGSEAERMRIDGNGLWVGSGGNEFNISESSDNITIKSAISDKDITISGNDGGSTVVAQHIDMSGGGITVFGGGTASAADTNTKMYQANAGPINILGTSSTDTAIVIGRWSNNATGGTLAFVKDRDGTIGDATALQDGDELGKIWFGAGDGVQNAYTYTLKTAQFSAYSDGATGNDGSGDPQTPSGFKWETNTGVAAANTAEVMRLNKNGALFLGDTANGNIATQGLTINQGDNSVDEVIALKASNVAHGRTTYGETDTFASFKQRTDDSGGLRITSFTGADTTTDSLNLTTYRRGQPNDLGTAAVSDYGAVDVFVTCHNGSNSAVNVDDDRALFSVTRRTGGNVSAAFIVNSTGELHTDAATGLTTDVFDKEDDVMLVRAFDLARDKESDKKTLIKSGWDKFAHKFEDRLVEIGILGKKIDEGGMLNLTRLLFLHNGAIFQEFEKRQVLEDKVKTLEAKLQAIGG